MKKIFCLIMSLFLLNGCAESVALLGSSIGGASSGKILQSSLNSAISYGVKHQTGKTPLGHVLTYAEKKNPEKKKETCFSFIEKTRSEFCTIAKKQISLTNMAVKEKASEIAKKAPRTNQIKDVILEKENNLKSSFFGIKKSPRKLAIAFQTKLRNKENSKIKLPNQYLFRK
tara:strand:- start:1527 stop:2042 length:516 start_codon:yes stop_codon:yes gene_type:complete